MSDPTDVVPFVRVTDLARAIAFYRESLGFEVGWTHERDDGTPLVAGIQRGAVRLYLTSMDECTVGAKLMLWVADWEALRTDLAARGVQVDQDHTHFGGPEIMVHDPDGNRIVWGCRALLPTG